MSVTTPEEYLQLDTVRVSAAGVSEMDQHRAVIFVPHELRPRSTLGMTA